jgi:hypothetical protein
MFRWIFEDSVSDIVFYGDGLLESIDHHLLFIICDSQKLQVLRPFHTGNRANFTKTLNHRLGL